MATALVDRSMLYRFHTNIFTPPGNTAESLLTLRGTEICKLTRPDGRPLLFESPLAVTWEYAAERLESLPRMIFEPDGSFVWAGQTEHGRWQVDGHLFEFTFDGVPRLHRIELHGKCPESDFDALLRSAGWPEARLVFELVMEGVALDEPDFRRWATAVGQA